MKHWTTTSSRGHHSEAPDVHNLSLRKNKEDGLIYYFENRFQIEPLTAEAAKTRFNYVEIQNPQYEVVVQKIDITYSKQHVIEFRKYNEELQNKDKTNQYQEWYDFSYKKNITREKVDTDIELTATAIPIQEETEKQLDKQRNLQVMEYQKRQEDQNRRDEENKQRLQEKDRLMTHYNQEPILKEYLKTMNDTIRTLEQKVIRLESYETENDQTISNMKLEISNLTRQNTTLQKRNAEVQSPLETELNQPPQKTGWRRHFWRDKNANSNLSDLMAQLKTIGETGDNERPANHIQTSSPPLASPSSSP